MFFFFYRLLKVQMAQKREKCAPQCISVVQKLSGHQEIQNIQGNQCRLEAVWMHTILLNIH